MNGPENDDLSSLASDLVETLLERGRTVAVAESSAGGLLACTLTSVPGASGVFVGGVTAYADRIKEKIGVAGDLLRASGAVSEETAEAMAEGVRRWCGADIGLAETGIAGPQGGSPSRPVGLFQVAVVDEHRILSDRIMVEGNRGQNRVAAARAALLLLRRYLEGKD